MYDAHVYFFKKYVLNLAVPEWQRFLYEGTAYEKSCYAFWKMCGSGLSFVKDVLISLVINTGSFIGSSFIAIGKGIYNLPQTIASGWAGFVRFSKTELILWKQVIARTPPQALQAGILKGGFVFLTIYIWSRYGDFSIYHSDTGWFQPKANRFPIDPTMAATVQTNVVMPDINKLYHYDAAQARYVAIDPQNKVSSALDLVMQRDAKNGKLGPVGGNFTEPMKRPGISFYEGVFIFLGGCFISGVVILAYNAHV